MSEGSELTVVAFQARQIEKAAKIMAHFVESTREDRLRWRPSTEPGSQTRSVMELVGECIFANRRFLSFLHGGPIIKSPENLDLYESVNEATSALKVSADELAAEIRKLQAQDLDRVITTHRGPMPLALAIQFPLRNMTYHMGQINMIQLLYGDTEFHVTEEFVTL